MIKQIILIINKYKIRCIVAEVHKSVAVAGSSDSGPEFKTTNGFIYQCPVSFSTMSEKIHNLTSDDIHFF